MMGDFFMDVFCEYIVKVKKKPVELLLSVLGVIAGLLYGIFKLCSAY